MKMLGLFLAMVLLATPALADDVDGKWTGNVATPNGDIPIAFEFKAEGTKLTGSMSGPDGGQIPIKNGTVEGSKIAFLVTLDFGGMSLDLSYTGVVSPAEIQLKGDFAGMPFEFVVKKAS